MRRDLHQLNPHLFVSRFRVRGAEESLIVAYDFPRPLLPTGLGVFQSFQQMSIFNRANPIISGHLAIGVLHHKPEASPRDSTQKWQEPVLWETAKEEAEKRTGKVIKKKGGGKRIYTKTMEA